MTLFNDLWKKFKVPPQEFEGLEGDSHPIDTGPSEPGSPTNTVENVLNAFQQAEVESLEQDVLTSKMLTLKSIVSEPKEEKLEVRFSKIKENLGSAECYETVRQERWPDNIRCPDCQSQNLKRIAQLPSAPPNKHRYRCLDCGELFDDDTGTPMEREVPSLNVWMHCWYLMGCTDSLTYIATKLGLELSLVEAMIERLRETFHTQKPLTNFLRFEEWNKQSQHLRTQLKEDLLREYERLNANVATVPKDTAEYRRQLNLRRDLKPSTAPPSGGRKR